MLASLNLIVLVTFILLTGCTAQVQQTLRDSPNPISIAVSDRHEVSTTSATWDIGLPSVRVDQELRVTISAAWIPLEEEGDLLIRQMAGPIGSAVVVRRSWRGATATNAPVTFSAFSIEHDRGSRYRASDQNQNNDRREEWRTFDVSVKFEADTFTGFRWFVFGSNVNGIAVFSLVYYAGGEVQLIPRGIIGSADAYTKYDEHRFYTTFE